MLCTNWKSVWRRCTKGLLANLLYRRMSFAQTVQAKELQKMVLRKTVRPAMGQVSSPKSDRWAP